MEKSYKSAKQQQPGKPLRTIETFWPSILDEIKNTHLVDGKHPALPLARIKKIMKLDENAHMIAAEAPILFAKACEFFIQELTMHAWTNTVTFNRRTLNRSDIAQAIANYDQFDFLLDIAPRVDIKPHSHKKNSHETNTLKNGTTHNFDGIGSAAKVSTQGVIQVSTDAVAALPLVTNLPIAGSVNVETPENTQTATQYNTAYNPVQQFQIMKHTTQPLQLQYFISLPVSSVSCNFIKYNCNTRNLPNSIATPLNTTNLNLAAIQQQQSAQTQQPQMQLVTNTPIVVKANQLNLLPLPLQQQSQQVSNQPTQQVIIPSNCQLLTAQLQQNQANSNNNSGTQTTILHQQPPQHHTNNQHTTNISYLNAGNPTATCAPVQTSYVSSDLNL